MEYSVDLDQNGPTSSKHGARLHLLTIFPGMRIDKDGHSIHHKNDGHATHSNSIWVAQKRVFGRLVETQGDLSCGCDWPQLNLQLYTGDYKNKPGLNMTQLLMLCICVLLLTYFCCFYTAPKDFIGNPETRKASRRHPEKGWQQQGRLVLGDRCWGGGQLDGRRVA